MRIINTYALMEGIEKYIVSGAVAGLNSVKWLDDNTPHTDGSTIYLPRPSATMTEEDLLNWRYGAEHELGHEDAVNCRPHWKEVMEVHKKNPKYKDDGLLWWISNLLSDHVQEHNRIGYMMGRDIVLKEGRQAFLQAQWKVMKGREGEVAACDTITTALFLWDSQCRQEWNEHITGLPKPTPEQQVVIDKVNACGVNPRVLRNEQEVFDSAVVIRALFDPDVQPETEAPPAPTMAPSELVSDKASDMMPGGAHDKKGTYVPTVTGSREYKARKGMPLGERKSSYDRGTSERTVIEGIKKFVQRTNLPSKVRAFLYGMKREKYTTGYRSGRLDTNRLSDVLRNKDDIFRRKEPARLVNSAVSLLVDASGSMNGTPFYKACASAVMLAESLQGIGVKVEIALFTEDSCLDTGLIHDLVLPFGQRFVHDRVYAAMGKMGCYLLNNADGENILFAYNRLKQQPEAKKILIVISDGEPSAEGPDNARMGVHEFTRQVIDTIQADKSVHLFGIGIEGFSADMYKNRVIVKGRDKLEPALLDLVKNAVLGV